MSPQFMRWLAFNVVFGWIIRYIFADTFLLKPNAKPSILIWSRVPHVQTKKAAEAAFLYEIQELTSDLDFRTEITEFLTEFINTARCINDLVLTGVERMRCGRNFNFH